MSLFKTICIQQSKRSISVPYVNMCIYIYTHIHTYVLYLDQERRSMTVVAESPASVCSCGSRLHYCGAPVTAKVLFPGGWDSLQHRRKRCQNSSCARYLKSVWYNFFVRDRQSHIFEWRSGQPGENMAFFFLTTRWCVSVEWLRQMSRRIAFLDRAKPQDFSFT